MNDLSSVTSQFTMRPVPSVSVVLPLHNAGRDVPDRIAEVAVDAELAQVNLTEIIVVDDGSHDLTWTALEAEARHEPRLRLIRLRRRFGEEAAREVGVFAATGDIVITLEPDTPAADLGQLERLLEAGFDVVTGWRGSPKAKPSHVLRTLTGLRLRNPFSATAAYRRDVLLALTEGGSPMFSLPLAAHRMGYRVGEMQIAAPARRGIARRLADLAALCSAAVMLEANERWLGLAMLAGVGMAASAAAVLALALLMATTSGVGLWSCILAIAGLALLLCGVQVGGVAVVGSLGVSRQRRRNRVKGWIAETLLQQVAPD